MTEGPSIMTPDSEALPYRTSDESGSPESAGTVAWNWISELAQAERDADRVLLEITSDPIEGGGRVTRLYRGTTLLAVATTFRDQMNHTVLVRWASPQLARAQITLATPQTDRSE